MSKTGKIWSRSDYLKMIFGAVIVIAITYALSPILGLHDVGSFLVDVAISLLILYVIPAIIFTVLFRRRRS